MLVYNCFDIINSINFIDSFIESNPILLQNKKIILVGNKYDVLNTKEMEYIYNYCTEKNLQNFFTSCKTKYGIKNLINFLVDNYLEPIEEKDEYKIIQDKFLKNKKKCCVIL